MQSELKVRTLRAELDEADQAMRDELAKAAKDKEAVEKEVKVKEAKDRDAQDRGAGGTTGEVEKEGGR